MYSAIEHLALSVWLNALRLRNLFAMFTAYFDENGNPNDSRGAFTVAGSISTIQKWLRFEGQWNAILKRYGVRVFHMQECARSVGEYEGWTTERRRSFIAELADCFARHGKHSFGVSIVVESWQQANREFQLVENFGTPYAFCGRLCVFMVREWVRKKNPSAPVEYYFENGAKDKGRLIELVERHEHVTPQFKQKALAPLQAADLIAWKNRRITQDIVNRPEQMRGDNFRDSLAAVNRVPRKFYVFDKIELFNFCKRHRVPGRGPPRN